MIEIDNLNCARKMQFGKIPYPFSAVAQYDFLCRAAPAALTGFEVNSLAKLFRRLYSSGICGGVSIADGKALLVVRGLGEDTSQLDLPRMSRLALRLALATHRILLHHRHSGPIHFDIESRNRLAHDNGQIQLDSFLDFLPFALSYIFSDNFCRALHRLGRHIQAC